MKRQVFASTLSPFCPRMMLMLLGVATFLLVSQVSQASLPNRNSAPGSASAKELRIATVSGFDLAFMLVDKAGGELRKTAELRPGGMEVKAADGSKSELLLFIAGPNGQPVCNAQVHYTIVKPSGEQITALAEPARGGYRAHLEWPETGNYQVQAKVATGRKTLTDQFVYKVD